MTRPETNGTKHPRPAIYSLQAVWGFSTVFTPLVGGVLAYNALRKAGKGEAARYLLGLGIGLLAAYFLLRHGLLWLFSCEQVYLATPQQHGWHGLRNLVSFGLNTPFIMFFGAAGYYLKREMQKALPDVASYPRQPVTVPLLVCLVIFGIPAVLFVSFIWAIGHMGP
jgi:MFS family permease